MTRRTLFHILGYLSIIVMGVYSYSCNVQERQIKKQHQLNYLYPNSLAEDCAKWFPVKDSTGTPIITPANNPDLSGTVDSLKLLVDQFYNAWQQALAGKTITTDTVRLKADFKALQDKFNKLQAKYHPCLPSIKTVPVYRVDNAKVTALTAQLRVKADSLIKVQQQLADSKKSKGHETIAIIILAVLLAVTWWVGIYKFFSGGAVTGIIKKL